MHPCSQVVGFGSRISCCPCAGFMVEGLGRTVSSQVYSRAHSHTIFTRPSIHTNPETLLLPILHPAPYTLHPTPHILHPPPFTLHPTPQPLNLVLTPSPRWATTSHFGSPFSLIQGQKEVASSATTGRSQDVCKGSWFTARGKWCVDSS